MDFKNKKAISTLLILILLLLMAVLIFTLISQYFDTTINDFKLNQKLSNFNLKFEIINIDNTTITVDNQFINDLTITNLKINNINCVLASNKINIGISDISISTCIDTLSLETIYTVILETSYGSVVENGLLWKENKKEDMRKI